MWSLAPRLAMQKYYVEKITSYGNIGQEMDSVQKKILKVENCTTIYSNIIKNGKQN